MSANLREANVLIVGGAGNIGSHVVDALVNEGADVTVYDTFTRGRWENLAAARARAKLEIVEGDVADAASLTTACAGKDYVLHLAAAWLLSCIEQPQLALTVNVQGTFNVLTACAKAKVRKLIFSSAGAVYGDNLQVPVGEEHPLRPNTHYGASKAAGEMFCESFYRTAGLPYVALRYWNVYGPRADVRGNAGQIIPKWLDLIEQGKPPTIVGDGSSSMDFVHVTDVARANLLACGSEVAGECFNIGNGVETTVKDLVAVMAQAFGHSIEPVYQRSDGRPPQRRWCRIDKARRLLGFEPAVSLEQGLRDLIAWRRTSAVNA